MNNDLIIEETVKEFIKGNTKFTSIDIANKIKSSGYMIRNISVTYWLRLSFLTKKIFDCYTKTLIDVYSNKNEKITATLYHPKGTKPSEYTNRNQKALTPKDVDSAKKRNGITYAKKSTDEVVLSKIIRSSERIKIPGIMIKKLGWKPGESVTPERASVIKTNKALPIRLRVNKDYRVSIPRHAVNFGNSPVKVMLNDSGDIVFERVS